MARRGRPTAELVLTDEERETLTRWARRPPGEVAQIRTPRQGSVPWSVIKAELGL